MSIPLFTYDTTPSTNDEALKALHAGTLRKAWFVARRQTKGRGREGRAWEAQLGNLLASFLNMQPCPPERAPQFGFVMALAVWETVIATTKLEVSRVRLKWPNDVLIDGAKVAGILVEGGMSHDGRFGLVAGIGLNIVSAPELAAYPTTKLQAHEPRITMDKAFKALRDATSKSCDLWQAGQNFAAIRQAWLERAGGIGQPVSITLAHKTEHGIFEGLDASGHLVLQTKTGQRRIHAGDLVMVPTPCASP